jgi:hypothetical protein
METLLEKSCAPGVPLGACVVGVAVGLPLGWQADSKVPTSRRRARSMGRAVRFFMDTSVTI